MSRLRLVVATLWAGSLWTIGLLVAPSLFMRLDRALAGTVAGFLFQAEAWLAVGCAAVLAGTCLLPRQKNEACRRSELVLIGLMLACTLLGYFALHPWMEALREAAGPAGIAASAERTTFAALHGVSSLFYFAESLLAVRLILRIGER